EYGRFEGVLTEDIVPRPDGPYGVSKLAGTRLLVEACRTTGIRGLTARLSCVYGPGEPPGRLLPALMDAARTGTSIPLTPGDQRRASTCVEAGAGGLLGLGAARPLGGEPVNLSRGPLVSVRAFIEIAAAVLGMPVTALDFGALPAPTDEMACRAVDLSRLRDLTGWAPETSVADGIGRTVDIERRSDPAARPR